MPKKNKTVAATIARVAKAQAKPPSRERQARDIDRLRERIAYVEGERDAARQLVADATDLGVKLTGRVVEVERGLERLHRFADPLREDSTMSTLCERVAKLEAHPVMVTPVPVVVRGPTPEQAPAVAAAIAERIAKLEANTIDIGAVKEIYARLDRQIDEWAACAAKVDSIAERMGNLERKADRLRRATGVKAADVDDPTPSVREPVDRAEPAPVHAEPTPFGITEAGVASKSVKLELRIDIERDDLAKVWVGVCPALDIISQGGTPEQALDATREAVRMTLRHCEARYDKRQAEAEAEAVL